MPWIGTLIYRPKFYCSHTIPYHTILLMEEILHQLICSLSHYLQGFIHPRWCRISAINSTIPWCNSIIFEVPDWHRAFEAGRGRGRGLGGVQIAPSSFRLISWTFFKERSTLDSHKIFGTFLEHGHLALFWPYKQIPSRKLTYPPKICIFEDDFPLPKVGYVSSLEGISMTLKVNKKPLSEAFLEDST